MRWCARLRAATAPATVVTRHGGGELSGPAERRLGYGNEREEEGKWKSSSQGLQRWPRRARGGTGADESTEGSFGGRRRNGDGDGVAGLPEGRGSVGRKEGVEAELLGASARLGVHGGCGNWRRWRRLRSGPRCGARGRAGEGDE